MDCKTNAGISRKALANVIDNQFAEIKSLLARLYDLELINSHLNSQISEPAGWTSDDIDVTNCNKNTPEQFCRDNIKLAPFFAMLANSYANPQPTGQDMVSIDKVGLIASRAIVKVVEEHYHIEIVGTRKTQLQAKIQCAVIDAIETALEGCE